MNKYSNLPLDSIRVDPEQPRKYFDQKDLQQLADSIQAIGVKQAISVRRDPSNTDVFLIIAGERRFQASILACQKTIPAILHSDESELTDESIFAHQLSENLHRVDLNLVEEAEFIQRRIDEIKESGEENPGKKVAAELGMSPSTISKKIKVLKYPDDIRSLVRKGLIRDYSLIKKVDELKGDRKKEAISLIEKGEFKSKEFLKRKRYEKTAVTKDNKPKKNNRSKQVKFEISSQSLQLIFKKTGFHSHDMPELDTTELKDTLPKFIEYLES